MSKSQESNMNPPIPAILYLRWSPKPSHAVDADTLEVQREICRKYCTAHGLLPAVELSDPDVSARKTPLFERPEGMKIPSLIAGGIKHVVAVRLDRVFRSTVDGLTCLNSWNSLDVALHLADQGGCSINCQTATGEMIATMLLAYASFEPRLTAERTKSSMLHKQRHGLRMTSEATIPWGWMSDPNSKVNERGNTSGIVSCAIERDQTHFIKRRLADGVSLSEIARSMNDRLDLCRGKPWNHGSVRRAANATWEEA